MAESHTSVLSSNQLSNETERLCSSNNSSMMKNNGGPGSSVSDVFEDDIEIEANSYFQQLFASRLTFDAMIQMLARYKESPEIREQLLFECMIVNLFEEYKFFNRYPEEHLKTVADLFGSVIKNKLVTHLTLGIALRAVLDALRKPPDSKMLTFGARALEKFLDRIVEWPQYGEKILQISHLRNTHIEIVNSIENVLARISPGHLESEPKAEHESRSL